MPDKFEENFSKRLVDTLQLHFEFSPEERARLPAEVVACLEQYGFLNDHVLQFMKAEQVMLSPEIAWAYVSALGQADPEYLLQWLLGIRRELLSRPRPAQSAE